MPSDLIQPREDAAMVKPQDDYPRRGSLPRALAAPVRRVLPKPRPGAVVEDEISGLVDCAVYKAGQRQEMSSIAEAHAAARRSKDAFVWLGMHHPPTEEFNRIAEQFGLHPLSVEDAIHAHQRPKIEVYGETLFAVLKTVRYVDHTEVIETGEIMLFLGEDFVVSVRHGAGSALVEVRRELEARPDVLAIGPATVLWAVFDRVVDDYGDAIRGLAEDIEQIEAAVFDPRVDSPTERIYKLKREVLEFRRAVDPLNEAIAPLLAGNVPLVDERTSAYFRDVQDHALQYSSRLSAFDELLRDVLAANGAQVTLRQNEDMRKITAWVAILSVITSIAGVYGMNFDNMPELHWANGYFICLALMATASVGLYAMFRRRNWL